MIHASGQRSPIKPTPVPVNTPCGRFSLRRHNGRINTISAFRHPAEPAIETDRLSTTLNRSQPHENVTAYEPHREPSITGNEDHPESPRAGNHRAQDLEPHRHKLRPLGSSLSPATSSATRHPAARPTPPTTAPPSPPPPPPPPGRRLVRKRTPPASGVPRNLRRTIRMGRSRRVIPPAPISPAAALPRMKSQAETVPVQHPPSSIP